MKFGITQESNIPGDKDNLIIVLSNNLEKYFNNKSYGSSINYFYVGIICVTQEFDIFFKQRKPRYKELSKIRLLDGTDTEFKGVYSYDIKLNCENFATSTIEECKATLATAILESLSNLDVLPKKVTDFDVVKFKSDLKHFFAHYTL